MLTSVTIANAITGYEGKFPLYTPSVEMPYIIKDIDGIGPAKAEIISSNAVDTDGTFVHSTRVGVRTIVLRIGYSPLYDQNQSMSGLRREMYNYLAPKSNVLIAMNENEFGHKVINGYVESHEPDIFKPDPEVVVTIVCDDPYFRETQDRVISNYTGVTVPVRNFTTANTGFIVELISSEPTTTVRIQNFVDDDIVCTPTLASGNNKLIS